MNEIGVESINRQFLLSNSKRYFKTSDKFYVNDKGILRRIQSFLFSDIIVLALKSSDNVWKLGKVNYFHWSTIPLLGCWVFNFNDVFGNSSPPFSPLPLSLLSSPLSFFSLSFLLSLLPLLLPFPPLPPLPPPPPPPPSPFSLPPSPSLCSSFSSPSPLSPLFPSLSFLSPLFPSLSFLSPLFPSLSFLSPLFPSLPL